MEKKNGDVAQSITFAATRPLPFLLRLCLLLGPGHRAAEGAGAKGTGPLNKNSLGFEASRGLAQ